MKKFFCFLGVLFLFLPVLHSEEYIGYNGEFHVSYPGWVNDFHIDTYVKCDDLPHISDYRHEDQNGNSVWHVGGVTMTVDPFNPNGWIVNINYESDDRITVGDVMEFGYKVRTNGYNASFHTDNHWTQDHVSVGTAMARAGFEVYKTPGGALMISLQNDFDTTVEVECLQFGVTDSEVPLDDMSPGGLGVSGQVGNQSLYGNITWVDYNQPIILAPFSNKNINLTDLNISLSATDFLQFRAVTSGRNWWGQSSDPE